MLKKSPPNPIFYLWFLMILIVIPVSCAVLAEAILKFAFLNQPLFKEWLRASSGNLHIGLPYYLSLLVSLPTTLLVVIRLRRRFAIYEIDAKNTITFLWIIVAAYLLSELLVIYFQPAWWLEREYKLKQWTFDWRNSRLYLYLVPHLANAILIFFALQTVIWISDIDDKHKQKRIILRKLSFTKEEFDFLLTYFAETTDKNFYHHEDFEDLKKEYLASKEKFIYADYKAFIKKIMQEKTT